jgi:hypothetical protein
VSRTLGLSITPDANSLGLCIARRCLSLLPVQRAVVKLQMGELGGALLSLPLDFSHVCQGLKKGGLGSLANIVGVVAQACQEAGVEAGFGQSQLKEMIMEQADALSGHLALALKVHSPSSVLIVYIALKIVEYA